MKYKNVLFDLDGTLTNPKEGITNSVVYALKHYGIIVENKEELVPFIGPPLYDSFMKYYGFDRKKAEEAVEVYREYFRPYGIFENFTYQGIEDMLSSLKEIGYTLLIASSKPEEFVRQITNKFQLEKYFDDQVGSTMDGTLIKKADVINEAIRRLDLNKAETVMVGDKSHDISGAKTAGIDAIGVRWGFASEGELESAEPVFIAENVAELYDFLRNNYNK